MAVKRRKNFLGFGGGKPSNYLPATGGIAYHSGKRKPAAGKSSADSPSVYDEIAKSLGYKSYKGLSAGNQATVRKLASKMSNPKRKRNAQLALPKNKWINAKIRVTKDGKVQAAVSQSVFGKAGVAGGFSLPNPKRKRRSTGERVGYGSRARIKSEAMDQARRARAAGYRGVRVEKYGDLYEVSVLEKVLNPRKKRAKAKRKTVRRKR